MTMLGWFRSPSQDRPRAGRVSVDMRRLGPLGPVLILGAVSMIKADPPKPIPLPVLLVYGKPARGDFPQAAWFRTEDRASVLAGAENLNFAVIEIKTAAEPSLLEGVHEGVLKGSGRMILGSVSVEVYRRIEE